MNLLKEGLCFPYSAPYLLLIVLLLQRTKRLRISAPRILSPVVPGQAMTEHFKEVLVLGEFPTELLQEKSIPVQQLPLPAELLDAAGRVPVRELVRYATQEQRSGYTLVLTDHDLSMSECSQLFGFADRRSGVAVISTARLGNRNDQDQLSRRLHNEMAHELGHLQGFRHCANSNCVMKPVAVADELDNRTDRLCGRCPGVRTLRSHLRSYLTTAAALCFLVLCSLGVNALATFIAGPPFLMPFT